jgi:hypothetical protein
VISGSTNGENPEHQIDAQENGATAASFEQYEVICCHHRNEMLKLV